MTIDAIESLDSSTLAEYADWAKNTGLWDGRQVTVENAQDFQDEVQSQIAIWIRNPDITRNKAKMFAAKIAYLGSTVPERRELKREIHALELTSQGIRVQNSLGKSMTNFWKKHHTAILIGLGVLAVITVVAIVLTCSAGTAAAALATAAACGLKKPEDEPTAAPELPPPSTTFQDHLPYDYSQPIKELQPITLFTQTELLTDSPSKYISFSETYHPTLPDYQSSVQFSDHSYAKLAKELELQHVFPPIAPQSQLYAQQDPALKTVHLKTIKYPGLPRLSDEEYTKLMKDLAPKVFSPKYLFGGKPSKNIPSLESINSSVREYQKDPHFLDMIGSVSVDPQFFTLKSANSKPEAEITYRPKVGGINGMNTQFHEAVGHARYFASFSDNIDMDWVYNRGYDAGTGFAESLVNYCGVSVNTAPALKDNWTKFHEDNKDHPNRKYLQFCHSQGAIHVNNALDMSDQEIRDRVIVIAIAPGQIVPKRKCFMSYNYASLLDVVPKGKLALAGLLSTTDPFEQSELVTQAMEDCKELIVLTAHKDAGYYDHAVQSPTFFREIKKHFDVHDACNGEYHEEN
jgi:hypothetical protein